MLSDSDWNREFGYYAGGYSSLVEAMPGEVALWVTGGSYQGDHYVLLKQHDLYGYLSIGYGSCSGCDALESCESFAEVKHLYEELMSDIVWRKADAMIEFFTDKTRPENRWEWFEEDFKHEFVPQALGILDAAASV